MSERTLPGWGHPTYAGNQHTREKGSPTRSEAIRIPNVHYPTILEKEGGTLLGTLPEPALGPFLVI